MQTTAVVVDDSLDMRDEMAGILTRMKIKLAAVCEGGSQGLAAIAKYKPTIATIDIQLPGINGIDLVRKARALSPDTIYVMCSGTVMKTVRDDATSAGAVAFIRKPYDQILAARELTGILTRTPPRNPSNTPCAGDLGL